MGSHAEEATSLIKFMAAMSEKHDKQLNRMQAQQREDMQAAIKQTEIMMQKKGQSFTEAQKKAMVKDAIAKHKNGWSFADIGAHYNIPGDRIRSWIKDSGAIIKSRPRIAEEEIQRVMDLVNGGMSMSGACNTSKNSARGLHDAMKKRGYIFNSETGKMEDYTL